MEREQIVRTYTHEYIDNRIFTFVLCDVHFQGFARELLCVTNRASREYHCVEYRDPRKLAAPSPSVKVYTSKEVVYASLFVYANYRLAKIDRARNNV